MGTLEAPACEQLMLVLLCLHCGRFVYHYLQWD